MTKTKTEYTVFFNGSESCKMYSDNDANIIKAAANQVLMLLNSDSFKGWTRRQLMEYKVFKDKKQILHITF